MKRELAIVGAGYVGVPLAQVFAEAGVPTVLVDVDAVKIESIQRGESYIEDVPSEAVAALVDAGMLGATTDYDAVRETDAIVIAVPTPLTRQREPDLSIVFSVATKLADRLRREIRKVDVEGRLLQLRASLGVAALAPGGEATADALVRSADAALYRAKRTGRDRVCVAGEEDFTEQVATEGA